MNEMVQHDPETGEVVPFPLGQIAGALAKAQAAITNPPRNREVEVYSKRTNSKYKFKYATLDAIIDAVRKPLTDNGIWFTQTLEANGGGKYVLRTTLLHESGEHLSSMTPLLGVDTADNQAFGSALTYMRRYALTALLGIAADEDDDANAADGNRVEKSKDRRQQPPDMEEIDRQREEMDAEYRDTVGPKPREVMSNKPHLIKLPPGPKGWSQWKDRFELASSTATTVQEFDAWGVENLPMFDDLKAHDPEVHSDLKARMAKFRARLEKKDRNAAVAGEP